MTEPMRPEGTPVAGELVELPEAAVIPSLPEQRAAADRARGRTAVQVGTPGALVVLGSWLARLQGIDLNPLPGVEDMPPEVVAAWVVIITVLLAFRMNPKPKAGG